MANKKPHKSKPFYRGLKRIFDIVFSFLLIVICSPLYLILMLMVKLSSEGWMFYSDNRLGRYGKEIKVWKFRTMYIDAETNIDDYLTPEQKEIWLRERKLDKDPRITKVGRIMRKLSLDELPQFFNILGGSMSFVGPRPITKSELEQHFNPKDRRKYLSVRPGLMGYWAVKSRSNADFDSGIRQKLELEYVDKRSVWFDIKIFFMAIPAVFSGKGAK